MIADLALSTIEELQAAGLSPTPAEICRINAFALRLENSPDALLDPPRAALLGGRLFYEPTCAALHWLDVFARPSAANWETFNALFLLASANARDPLFFTLPENNNVSQVQKKAQDLVNSLAATKSEVLATVKWLRFGTDPSAGEDLPEGAKKSKSLFDLVAEASGVGIASPGSFVPRALTRAIRHAWDASGKSFKFDPSQLYGDFLKVVNEVKDACLLRNTLAMQKGISSTSHNGQAPTPQTPQDHQATATQTPHPTSQAVSSAPSPNHTILHCNHS